MPIGGAAPQGYQKNAQMSCFDKVKMGFGMGFCIGKLNKLTLFMKHLLVNLGMATGVLLGGFQALRFGLRGRELVGTVGKSMLQAGGSFGVFMGVGTALRC